MVHTLKPLAIFVLVSALAPVMAFSQDRNCSSSDDVVQQVRAAEENSIKLKNMIFTGNTVLPVTEQERIAAVLSEKTFKTRKDINEELKDLIRHEWQQRGYFKVEVGEPEIKLDGEDHTLFSAIVWVEAGHQYRMGELRFVKNTVFPSEKLRSLFPLQTGEVFNTYKVGKGIEEARKLYGASGYVNMAVLPTTEQRDDDNRVNLTIELDEGRQFRVGKVEVLGGDEAKREQFISASGLVTGSVYNSMNLQKAFASGDSDGFEATDVVRTIIERNSTVDFKVDLRPCVAMSQK